MDATERKHLSAKEVDKIIDEICSIAVRCADPAGYAMSSWAQTVGQENLAKTAAMDLLFKLKKAVMARFETRLGVCEDAQLKRVESFYAATAS